MAHKLIHRDVYGVVVEIDGNAAVMIPHSGYQGDIHLPQCVAFFHYDPEYRIFMTVNPDKCEPEQAFLTIPEDVYGHYKEVCDAWRSGTFNEVAFEKVLTWIKERRDHRLSHPRATFWK